MASSGLNVIMVSRGGNVGEGAPRKVNVKPNTILSKRLGVFSQSTQ